MESETTLPHFYGWSNVEEGYYTKTKLKNEFGLKPLNPTEEDVELFNIIMEDQF